MMLNEWIKKHKVMTIILILLFFYFLSTNQTDKKESSSEFRTTLFGGAVIAVPFLLPLLGISFPFWGFVGVVLGGIYLLINGAVGLATPDPTIPIWVWIIGFALLAIMMFRRK